MKLTNKQYAVALYEELENSKPSDHSEIFAKFIRLLAGKNRLSLLPQIIEQLGRHSRAQAKISLVQITTAKPLPESNLKKIKKSLEDTLDCEIELEAKVDEKIIGGAIIQLDDTIINGSIAQELNQLNATLAQSHLTA